MTKWWSILAGLVGLLLATGVCRASDANDAIPPRLAGTLVSATGREALVQFRATNAYVVVEVGDTLGSWTVAAIEAGSIRLTGTNGWVELTLSSIRSIDDAAGTSSPWTNPCGRAHTFQNVRRLRDAGACIRAALGREAS